MKEFVNNAILNVMDVSTTVPLALIVLLDSSNVDHHVVKHAHQINLSKVLLILVYLVILNVKLAQLNNFVLLVLILKQYQSMVYVMIVHIHAKLVEQHHQFVLHAFKDSV